MASTPKLRAPLIALSALMAMAGLFGGWALLGRGEHGAGVVTLEKAAGEEAWALLDAAPWASPVEAGATTGPVLYVVGFPSCPSCKLFHRVEAERLIEAGVALRGFVFLLEPDEAGRPRSTPAEEALAAALYEGRSWALYEAWIGRGNQAEAAAANRGLAPVREDGAKAGEEGLARWAAISRALAAGGGRGFISPTFVWRRENKVRVLTGFDAAKAAVLREEIARADR